MKLISGSKRTDLTYTVFFWTLFAVVAGKMSDTQFVVLNSLVLGYYFGNRVLSQKTDKGIEKTQ